MTDEQIAALADGLTKELRRIIVKTPHPQPMPDDVWLWAGSILDAIECGRLGLIDKDGFTQKGIRVRAHLENSDAQ